MRRKQKREAQDSALVHLQKLYCVYSEPRQLEVWHEKQQENRLLLSREVVCVPRICIRKVYRVFTLHLAFSPPNSQLSTLNSQLSTLNRDHHKACSMAPGFLFSSLHNILFHCPVTSHALSFQHLRVTRNRAALGGFLT